MSSLSGAKYKAKTYGAEAPPGGVPPKDALPKESPSNPSTSNSDVAASNGATNSGAASPAGANNNGSANNGGQRDMRAFGREIALLQKAQVGDRAAYGQIVVLYQDRLFNALLRMVGEAEEARELTQETFTRGLEKIDGFRGEASPYTWLFRIGMNLAISNLRRSQRARVFSLDGERASHGGNGQANKRDQAAALVDRIAAADGDSPPAAVERSERHKVVLDALGRIDSEYRAVLVMRDVEGFEYQDMADVLGLPLGTLKSRLFRARLALRDELSGYMAERKKGKKESC
jgi:RNA polymerase sigma-70 factor (ECF subfamily)